MNTTVQKKKLHAKFGCGPTVVKITNATAIKVVWRTTSQQDKTRLAAFGTWLFTLRLVRAHQHVSYHKSHTHTRVRTHDSDNCVLLREAGVLGPCNTETVEISWLVGWSQSVSIYCPCEQQTLNKKIFTGAHKKHLKFILLFSFHALTLSPGASAFIKQRRSLSTALLKHLSSRSSSGAALCDNAAPCHTERTLEKHS